MGLDIFFYAGPLSEDLTENDFAGCSECPECGCWEELEGCEWDEKQLKDREQFLLLEKQWELQRNNSFLARYVSQAIAKDPLPFYVEVSEALLEDIIDALYLSANRDLSIVQEIAKEVDFKKQRLWIYFSC